KVERDARAESDYIEQLRSLGLQEAGANFFSLPEGANDFLEGAEWLISRKTELEALGFDIVTPTWDDLPLSLEKGGIELVAREESDWFDIKGEIAVGPHRFPFLKLAPYIREGNRLYPLPDDSFFLIPSEWMTRYRDLAKFAQKKAGKLKLTRSQAPLLEEVGLAEGGEREEIEAPFELSPLLKADLRSYQVEGVQWLVSLYRQQLGACLADDMGLGKTLQTLAVLLHAKERKATLLQDDKTGQAGKQIGLFQSREEVQILQPLNALIILPASLIFNWENEIRKFAPSLTTYAHIGSKRHRDIRLLARFDIILTTYQTALRDVDLLARLEYEYIVLDESQQIKNRESKAFRAINSLEGRHKISLSGTPIENSLSDLWSQMQFINPDLLGSYAFFKREFITPIEKRQDEASKERLRKLVSPYLLRRTKEEVATDLPPLTTQVFYTDMTREQRRMYEREKSAVRNNLLDQYQKDDPKYKMMVLRSLTKLRQLANHPVLVAPKYEKESGKFRDVLEQWEIIRKSGHKVLMFSSFVKYLELFRGALEASGSRYSWLSGDLSQNRRKENIRQFQEDPEVQAFLISIKTGGTGLNLTAADYVFVLDPWWNPSTEQQAIARAHRIGQDNHVIARKFIAVDSIEEKILKLQERKAKLAEDIVGPAGKMSFSKGELAFLLG
ncbi:MAG: DEAD/DEAH box helicase, partial [Saprospiraceae bacterium]|nr:DEAD/DEAH box helicase [Saprospiraceae bacterium]